MTKCVFLIFKNKSSINIVIRYTDPFIQMSLHCIGDNLGNISLDSLVSKRKTQESSQQTGIVRNL